MSPAEELVVAADVLEALAANNHDRTVVPLKPFVFVDNCAAEPSTEDTKTPPESARIGADPRTWLRRLMRGIS